MSKILIDEEAMKLALEALEIVIVDVKSTPTAYEAQRQAITALREALAQPAQQEPVGYEHHVYSLYGAPGEVRIRVVLASQYKLPNGSISGDFQWLIDEYRADPNTIKLVPLYKENT